MINNKKVKKIADNPIKRSVLRLQNNFDMNDELHSKRLLLIGSLMFLLLFVGIWLSVSMGVILPLIISACPILIASIVALLYTILLFVFSLKGA